MATRCKIPPPASMSILFGSDYVTQMPSSFIYLSLLLSIARSHLMAGYGGGQCNRRRVSDKAGLWHGMAISLISCRIILSLCLCDRMSFEWPGRPAQHFSEGRVRVGSSAFASRSRSASGTKRARHRQNFLQNLSQRDWPRSKIDICMYGVSHSGQPFASHVLEKLDSELQQQKGAFVGSRVRVLIS